MKPSLNDSGRKSVWITISIQIALLAILYFAVAWKEPFPPIPEYRIELAILDISGGESQLIEKQAQVKKIVENEVEEVTDVPEQEISELKVNEELDEPEDEALESPETNQVVDEYENEDTAEEIVDANPDIASNESESQEVLDESQELDQEPTKENEINDELVEDPIDSSTIATDDSKSIQQVIDERAIYGNGNSNEAGSIQLEMAGFSLYQEPTIDDDSDESGMVTYRITVDDEGYIIGTELVESTISPSTELLYRRAVEQLVLERTSSSAPTKSTGTIKFIIKSN